MEDFTSRLIQYYFRDVCHAEVFIAEAFSALVQLDKVFDAELEDMRHDCMGGDIKVSADADSELLAVASACVVSFAVHCFVREKVVILVGIHPGGVLLKHLVVIAVVTRSKNHTLGGSITRVGAILQVFAYYRRHLAVFRFQLHCRRVEDSFGVAGLQGLFDIRLENRSMGFVSAAYAAACCEQMLMIDAGPIRRSPNAFRIQINLVGVFGKGIFRS